jgi:hypothetical protein
MSIFDFFFQVLLPLSISLSYVTIFNASPISLIIISFIGNYNTVIVHSAYDIPFLANPKEHLGHHLKYTVNFSVNININKGNLMNNNRLGFQIISLKHLIIALNMKKLKIKYFVH